MAKSKGSNLLVLGAAGIGGYLLFKHFARSKPRWADGTILQLGPFPNGDYGYIKVKNPRWGLPPTAPSDPDPQTGLPRWDDTKEDWIYDVYAPHQTYDEFLLTAPERYIASQGNPTPVTPP